MDLISLIYIIWLVLLVYLAARPYWEGQRIAHVEQKPVFITGCDSGFGFGLAVKCAQHKIPVFAGCRTAEGIEKLTEALKEHRESLHAFLLDVTSDESVEEARRIISEKLKKYPGLHAVVNNAGIVGCSFYDEFLSMQDYRETLEVNLFGVIRVTKAFVPLLRKTKGRIVNMASMCARLGLPGIGPYTVAKHGVSAYSDVIRQELRVWGISVHVLEPGFFRTPLIADDAIKQQLEKVWNKCTDDVKRDYGKAFFEKGCETTKNMMDSVASENTQWVVDTYFHALTAKYPRRRYQIGWDHILFFHPMSMLPAAIADRIFMFGEKWFGAPVPQAVLDAKCE